MSLFPSLCLLDLYMCFYGLGVFTDFSLRKHSDRPDLGLYSYDLAQPSVFIPNAAFTTSLMSLFLSLWYFFLFITACVMPSMKLDAWTHGAVLLAARADRSQRSQHRICVSVLFHIRLCVTETALKGWTDLWYSVCLEFRPIFQYLFPLRTLSCSCSRSPVALTGLTFWRGTSPAPREVSTHECRLVSHCVR